MYIWHPAFHRLVAREHLAFVLVAFPYSAYRRARTTTAIEAALGREGVRSFALWELLGDFDLLVQAWLPPDVKASQLGRKIELAIPGITVTTVPLTVSEVKSHWLWPETFDASNAVMAVEPSHFGALKEPDYNRIPQGAVKRYAQQRYLGRLLAEGKESSIKFFLRISLPRSRNFDNEQELLDTIKQALGQRNISGAAVFEVDSDSLYLITGRVRPNDFSHIAQFADDLRASGRLAALGSRTTTHVSALPTPLVRHEQLLPEVVEDAKGKPESEEVRSLLLLAENDELEFKASAFTDISHKVRRPRGQPARTITEQVGDIAKAICGMANAYGGAVIVGVAELGTPPKRFTLDELRRTFPTVEVVNEERAVIGIVHEYLDATGWDRYERTLRDRLKNLVEGGLDSRIKMHPIEVSGTVVCFIRVPRGRHFYFVTSKDGTPVFYGREGGQTQRRDGQRMMSFMEEHPRQ